MAGLKLDHLKKVYDGGVTAVYDFDIDCNILDAGTYILKLESNAEYNFTGDTN